MGEHLCVYNYVAGKVVDIPEAHDLIGLLALLILWHFP